MVCSNAYLLYVLACVAFGLSHVHAAAVPEGAGIEDGRESLEATENPFSFLNDACKADPKEHDKWFNLKACPRSLKYDGEHCNHCCFAGASSLQLRWRGCPGDVRFASGKEVADVCQLWPRRAPTDGLRFVSCACYQNINTPGTFKPEKCELSTTITLTKRNDDTVLYHSRDYVMAVSDICIVSVTDVDGHGAVIDFAKPLPPTIGLVHTVSEEYKSSPCDNPTKTFLDKACEVFCGANTPSVKTFFDTTCAMVGKTDALYSLPIFPGYGKLPNTCPDKGFVDLDFVANSPLPKEVDQHEWKPDVRRAPKDKFVFYEFVDGTSAGFWPIQGEEVEDDGGPQYYFLPTFAACRCVDFEELKRLGCVVSHFPKEPIQQIQQAKAEEPPKKSRPAEATPHKKPEYQTKAPRQEKAIQAKDPTPHSEL